jgi:hypothetical protein
MKKINYQTLLLLILSLTLFSCTYSQDNAKIAQVNKSKQVVKTTTKKTICQNRSIIVSKFIDIPSDILESGCGVSLYRNDKEFKEQEFIWVDNSTNGVIKINGKLQKLSAVIENGKVMPIFKNTIYMVTYKITSSIPISDESANLKGILIVRCLNSSDSITINVVGVSGC